MASSGTVCPRFSGEYISHLHQMTDIMRNQTSKL